MYNENTKGILNLFDLRIHKSIVESNLLLEFAEMKGNKDKIKSNGDTWIYVTARTHGAWAHAYPKIWAQIN